MRTFSKMAVLSFTLTLLLSSPLCVHLINDLTSAQGTEDFTRLTYLPISPQSEQLSVIPLPSGGPSARNGHTAVKDKLNNEMIIFGGAYFDIEAWDLHRYNDVWKLGLDSYTWTQISTSGTTPLPVSCHSAIYDPEDHRMLVFGGALDVGVSDNMYELDLNSCTWNLVSTAGETPSPRWEHSAVYNSRDHTMAIFGGRDLNGTFNDLWILDLHTLSWQRIESYGPSERMAHSAIYVPIANSMLVFGGSNYFVDPWPHWHYNDLWEFSFDTQSWTQLFTTGATLPPPRDAHFASHDGVKNRMLVFGGIADYDVILNDLWELDLNTLAWSRLFPNLARDRSAGIFDESSQELIFFGGGFHGQPYMFADGFRIIKSVRSPAFENGDANCDGEINIADVVYLVNYLFAGGPKPSTTR